MKRTYEVVCEVTLAETCEERPDEVAEAISIALCTEAAWLSLESTLGKGSKEIDCECTLSPREGGDDE